MEMENIRKKTLDMNTLLLCADAQFLGTTRNVLNQLHITPEIVSNGTAALEFIQHHEFDVIIVDWREIENLGDFLSALRKSKLNHEGVLVAQDIFVRETSQYAAYRGPGKLEGSIVNWLNGPIFQIVGDRLGFKVDVEPFAYREGSNTAVLTARHRDTHRVALGTETTAEDAGLAPAAA
jgi:spermidine synthase